MFGNLQKIEPGALDKFTSLHALGIQHTGLSHIDDQIFTETVGVNLWVLHLGNNNLSSISATTFQHFTNLSFLDLGYNPKIAPFIRKDLFPETLATLKFLSLTSCNITHLDDDVFDNLR